MIIMNDVCMKYIRENVIKHTNKLCLFSITILTSSVRFLFKSEDQVQVLLSLC